MAGNSWARLSNNTIKIDSQWTWFHNTFVFLLTEHEVKSKVILHVFFFSGMMGMGMQGGSMYNMPFQGGGYRQGGGATSAAGGGGGGGRY